MTSGPPIAVQVLRVAGGGWQWVARTASGDRVGDSGETVFLSSEHAVMDARASAPPSATITVIGGD